MFSFTRIVLSYTEKNIYYLGLQLTNDNRVVLSRVRNNGCCAVVKGNNIYPVDLGFTRIGIPYFDCICRYYCEQQHLACKHIVATSLTYDRQRCVPDPNVETVENAYSANIFPLLEKPLCHICNYLHLT